MRKNENKTVKRDINQFDDYIMNGSKKILYMNELDDERKHILDNLLKKNQKYQDVLNMIDTNNYYTRNKKNAFIIERRIFSERKKKFIQDEIHSLKEKRKTINKEQKIKKLYDEIDSLQKKDNYDFSKQNTINTINTINSINNKPTNIFSFYLSNIDNKNNNKNKIQLRKNHFRKNQQLFTIPKNFLKLDKYSSFNFNKTKDLNDNDIKKWIKNEKYNKKEPLFKSYSNYLDFSKNTFSIENKNKNKKKYKSIIYYSNDFFEVQLDNFERDLNKVGRNDFHLNKDFKRGRLLSS